MVHFPNSMKITQTGTAPIEFSQSLGGNRSEKLCTLTCEVHTVLIEGFKADGFVSPEYTPEMEREIVCVSGRYFTVGTSESGTKRWRSVTLPQGMDPRPQPREWDVMVTKCPVSNNQYLWDPRCASASNPEKIRVREVID